MWEVWQWAWDTEGQGLFSCKIQTFSINQQRSATTSQISHEYLYIGHVTASCKQIAYGMASTQEFQHIKLTVQDVH
jgi:hypothetical protein